MDNQKFYESVKPIIDKAQPGGGYSIDIAEYNRSGHCIFNAFVNDIREIDALRLFAFVIINHPAAQVEIAYRGMTTLKKSEVAYA